MPANLTPQYLEAEKAFRQAQSLGERISCLEEMLRVIPKHKGTDHLQGDEYFKIHREDHNLDRCRTQFKLVADMETHFDKMQKIVEKYR